MIDVHCHILPALDDGALDLEDSVAMAAQAVEDGIEVVCATPHIRPDHLVRVEELPSRVAAVQLDPSVALEPHELERLVADSLATYKHLRHVVVVDVIPRLPSGKVLRRTLRDELSPTLISPSGEPTAAVAQLTQNEKNTRA